ncbi:MAG: ABC transporter permease subunit, partial [Planctomycetaceae bacterium]|nr:ABC transporter permease subunit [Planctomycetaceae bacterium]
MSWKNVKLIFLREVRDQLRDRRTLFMITILPVLLYPMLGLGMVEMMLTFSEQKRSVVVLNADQLPEEPAFLAEDGIGEQWFSGGAEDAARLQIIADNRQYDADNAAAVTGRRRRTPAQLLRNGQQVAEQISQLMSVDPATLSAEQKREQEDRVTDLFAGSGVQVLVMVPEGYAAAIGRLKNDTEMSADSIQPPVLRIVRNSADDKSAVASDRVEQAFLAWETELRRHIFEHADLRSELFHPASIKSFEMARGDEMAANVWSKLFPAMIVIMALTGAFYPAIDLGAGEKERGTMETLLISPARRVELVLGKFGTILVFSIGTAVMNLLSMGLTGSHMASTIGATMDNVVGLEFPGMTSLVWLAILLVPLASLFSALCLALATFAKSTKEGQYYLTPLLMVIMGLTMFSLSPAVEITPLYSVIPVINISLLLKGLLLSQSPDGELLAYAVPVLISSFGYSVMALWWAIDLYNSEGVLFRAADKFSVKGWLSSLTRGKEPVPAPAEAGFCFIIILLLQFI